MRILYVGDNSRGPNWGRAASIALRQLLESEFQITGTVFGESFVLSSADAGFVGAFAPAFCYPLLRYAWERRSRRPFGTYIKLEKSFGAHDFVSEDPSKGLQSLLADRHRHSALQKIYNDTLASDIVVIDGDGDIIFSNPPRRETLFILTMVELALYLKKPVCVVNAMLSDSPNAERNQNTLVHAKRLFEQCELLSLRDPESVGYARAEMPTANIVPISDSLFAWASDVSNGHFPTPSTIELYPFADSESQCAKFDCSLPYICIGGGALSCSDPNRARVSYGKLVDALLPLGYQICLTENDTPDSFLRQVANEKGILCVQSDAPIRICTSLLANSRLFLSGRYHPSIMASLGGAPCIFFGSHAHKMGSLSDVLKYESRVQFSAFPTDEEITQIIALARTYLQEGEALRSRIRAVALERCREVQRLPKVIADSCVVQ